MAKIVPSETAPGNELTYALGNVDFTLAPGGVYETDDRDVISNAVAHPWLEVEYDAVPQSEIVDDSRFDPSKDALSAENSIAFDPEEVAKARAEAEAQEEEPTIVVPERTPADEDPDEEEVQF